MRVLPAISLLILLLCRIAAAEDFVAPEAYPMNRYEAGWLKNPFTLKTAPPAIQKDSFAKDLALGSTYKIDDRTTVILVNTKTHVRTTLHGDEEGPGGMKVKAVHVGDRKETFVELEEGTETAVVRFDENFLKTIATTGGPKNGMPGVNKGQVPPPMPMVATNQIQGQPGMTGNPAIAPPTAPVGTPSNPYNTRSTFPPPGGGSFVPTRTSRRMMNVPQPIQQAH